MKNQIIKILFGVALVAVCATGCGKNQKNAAGEEISVVSREDGSGTRGAFIELFGIEEEDENGEKVDKTYEKAEVTNSTSVMLTTVEGNKNATIDIQQNDSTTGVNSAIEGICDIGMASRELKDTEVAGGVKSTVIAMDGIAVVVNKDNAVDDLTTDQVKSIFTGETTDWEKIK